MLIFPFAGTSSADSIRQLSIASEKAQILDFKVKDNANRESTKKTVFVLYNHGKQSLNWGLNWFFSHDYSWGKGVNDFLKKFNEIIAMLISALVFFVEFWFNVFVYYIVGAIAAIYGVVVCLVGLILIPLIAIWNFFLWLISLL